MASRTEPPPTGDLRGLMVQMARVEERIATLIKDNDAHKKDFRWTWGGLAAAFLVLSGMFIYGYDRLDDKLSGSQTTLATLAAKIDDLLQRSAPRP
jgi:hypothetical protein